MSAFSDCNGPAGCGSGPALPQVVTLERLIQQISVLEGQIVSTLASLNTHKTDPLAHEALRTMITAAKGVADSAQAAINSHTLDNVRHITAAERAQWSGATSATQVSQQINQAWTGQHQPYVDQKNLALTQALQALILRVNVLNGTGPDTYKITMNDLKQGIVDIANLRVTLQAFVKLLKTGTVRDFVEWTALSGIWAAVTYPQGQNIGRDNSEFLHTQLLAQLSEEWDAPIAHDGTQTHCARIYVKFMDSQSASLIIDVTATKRASGPIQVGSIFMSGSKTMLADIRAGVYQTTGVDGKPHVYIGVYPKGTNTLSTMVYNIACDGCYPITPAVADAHISPPNGGVTSLACTDGIGETFSATAGTFWVDRIIADYLEVQHAIVGDVSIYDNNGNVINIITVEGDTAIIGDPEHPYDIFIYSKDRPTIIHGDGSAHKVGYLTDFAQSIYWQRGVTVICETLAELTALKVRVAADGVTILPRDSTAGSLVPGFYISETSLGADGHIFVADDDALLKDGGLRTTGIADGRINIDLSDFPDQSWFNVDLVTIAGEDFIKLPPLGHETDLDYPATSVIDRKGNFGRIIRTQMLPNMVWQYMVQKISASDSAAFFNYKQPAYATFNGTSWTKTQDVELPTTFDGQNISDVTYQWSGAVKIEKSVGGTFFEYSDSYVLWSAHQQNNLTMMYPGNGKEWSILSLITVNVHPIPCPVGSILGFPECCMAAPKTPPIGWYRCDGSEVTVDDNLELFQVIGNTFGTPSDNQHFVLPQQNNAIIRWNPHA